MIDLILNYDVASFIGEKLMSAAFIEQLTTHLSLQQRRGRPLLTPPVRWSALANGGADPHDAIIFFLFEDRHPLPALVVKVPRLPEDGRVLQVEYERMVELWNCLGEQAALRIPEPIAMLNIDGQPALVISYIPGESLLRSSRKRLWANPDHVQALAVDAARSLRSMMDRTAVPLRNGEKIETGLLQKAEKFKQMHRMSVREQQTLSEVLEQVDVIGGRATHKVLIQGDFWHGNIIRHAEHGQLMFVDWQYARWDTDASLDLYLFLLAGALADAPQSPVEERARVAMDVLRRWRPRIIPAYLRAFGQPEEYGLLPIRAGMLLCCLEKAVRASMDAGMDLENDTVWRLLFAELASLPEDDDFYKM